MDAEADIRESLTSRRARITPQPAGLPAYGTNRRLDLLASWAWTPAADPVPRRSC